MSRTEIKAVRKEIANLLAADSWIEANNIHIYPNSTLPGKFNREVCTYSGGNMPSQMAVLGKQTGRPSYQMTLLWSFIFGNDQLATEEDVVDDFENAVYRILLDENYSNSAWQKIVFPNYSRRSLTLSGTQNSHNGGIIMRITVR